MADQPLRPAELVRCPWCKREVAIRQGALTQHPNHEGWKCEGSYKTVRLNDGSQEGRTDG